MQQEECMESPNTAPIETVPQQPQIFITNNTKNLLLNVLGGLLGALIYFLSMAYIFICVKRGWCFLLMFIIGMVTFVWPVYRLKEKIGLFLSFAIKYVKRTWVKWIIGFIGVALFSLSLVYIPDKDNYDSKLIAGILLYLLGGYISSVLTYKVYKVK